MCLRLVKETGKALYLLSWVPICSGGEGQEHRVAQEVQVGLEAWHAKAGPQINRHAALDQRADQMAEATRQRVLLAARLNLIQLHLPGEKTNQKPCHHESKSLHRFFTDSTDDFYCNINPRDK